MWKFWNTRDENAAEKPKPAQSDMLIARERALKATIRANEILSKAGSINKELENMEQKFQRSLSLPFQLGFALVCLIIAIILVSSISRYAH
jgi:hypothetical protein